MPKFYAADYKITVGTAYLSTSVNSVTLDITADEVETTAFGSTFTNAFSIPYLLANLPFLSLTTG